ncbi:MAG: Nitrogen regulatory protein P-II [Candidatus Accumulibacter regalis]|jgi:nitrogen regulatory protein P-II 1|uniref:Nitrogen regulatory protein P-II n=1 Tax=Accumulibacter regalis TaxID=522306 RepID=A0A011PQ53_ACCRE|nr:MULTISPECIES: P-II family nitrogen regulator [unclassified Candidatus Accumulibacter]EXI89566.1 MAG: Nitrogen regulatory protein P-II [Candidatus Accumulibacter regalis]MQM35697.1 transcriptional regulator [Candidatus Accumulibacter phosphatis]MBL8366343.1 P-II family nitrogen regulator [Accumulibacter sp.]MBN8512941.1 P-II family nitrogen regulator [Accumulibacter sp.]MBO3703116.1 P-II family nitrogen regulator [Accumulibacter sp.]
MSNKNELIVLTDVMLITVIVQRGVADQVVQVAVEAGAQGATVFHAHGTGVRQKRLGILGLTVNTEKEIIYIVVPSEQADTLFERIFVSAKMDTPGMGILWMTRLDKMSTYVPHDVAARFGVHTERAG